MSDKQNLDQEIESLRREIAKLSALLAFKKAESEHPSLRKLTEEVENLYGHLYSGVEKFEAFRDAHCPFAHNKVLRTVMPFVVFGTLGWLLSHLIRDIKD